jgi:hypothetical protein
MQIKGFLYSLFLFFNILLTQPTFGQRLITGKVLNVNSKLPVENVAVTVFMGTNSTVTNSNGYFQMNINDKDSLVFTHPDYKSGGLKPPKADVFIIYVEQYHYYPDYIGGNEALYLYLQTNLKYPRKARSKRVEGMILVEVKVDSSGAIVDCNALNELCKNCSEDIISVFKKIPGKWSTFDEPVLKSIIFPLEFRINYESKLEAQVDSKSLQGKLMPKMVLTAFAAQGTFR